MDRDNSSVLPHLGRVMGAENRTENLGKEGNRSLGMILQGPDQARCIADLQTDDGFVNLVRVG